MVDQTIVKLKNGAEVEFYRCLEIYSYFENLFDMGRKGQYALYELFSHSRSGRSISRESAVLLKIPNLMNSNGAIDKPVINVALCSIEVRESSIALVSPVQEN